MANETRVKGLWHLMRIDDNCKLADADLRKFIEELNDLTSDWGYEIVFTIYDKKEDFLIEGEFSALGCDSFVDNLEWLTDESDECNRRLYDQYVGNTNFIIFFRYDEFDEAMGVFNKEAVSSLIFHNRNYAPILGANYYVVEPEERELLKKEIIDSRYFDNSIIDSIFYQRCGKPYQEDLSKLDEEDSYLAILFKLLEITEEKDAGLLDLSKEILSKVHYGKVYDLETGREFVRNKENQKWLDSYKELYNRIIKYENSKKDYKIAEENFKNEVRKIIGGK